MSTLNITADASAAIDTMRQFNTALNQQANQFKDVTNSVKEYNAFGDLTKQTISGLDDAGRKLTATLKYNSSGLADAKVKYGEFRDSATSALRAAVDGTNKVSDATKGYKGVLGDLAQSAKYYSGYILFSNIASGLKEGSKEAMEFQTQIGLIRALTQDNQLSFSNYASKLREVSDATGTDIISVSKAALDTVSNQIAKGNGIFTFLRDADKLAKVTGGTIEQSVGALSSIINSYGLEAKDAERLSALLFKTVDEGRIKLSELGNGMGRVTILAKGLGVTIEEVATQIAFLTQKGVTGDDAMTFLKNVFLQMQKPSTELSALFDKIGVSSGAMAIKVKGGLAGFITYIKQLVDSGNEEVAKLFPEIKANIPIQAALNDLTLLTKMTKDFNNEAKNLENFNGAVALVAETSAANIKKSLNQIKNFFIDDFGNNILNFVSKLFTSLENLGIISKNLPLAGQIDEIIDKLIYAGVVLGGMVLGFRAAQFAAVTFGLTTSAALGPITLVLTAITVAVGVLSTEYIKQNQILSLAPKKYEDVNKQLDEFIAKQQKAIYLAGELFQAEQNALIISAGGTPGRASNIQDTGIEDYNKKQETLVTSTIATIAKLRSLYSRNLAEVKAQFQDTSSEIKNIFNAYLKDVDEKINSLKQRLTILNQGINNSNKFSTTFGDRVDNTISDARQESAQNDNERIDYIIRQEKDLQKKIRTLRKEAYDLDLAASRNNNAVEGAEQAKLAEQKLDEARKLAEKEIDLIRKKYDLDTKLRQAGYDEYVKNDPHGVQSARPTLDILNLEKELLAVKKDQLVVEQKRVDFLTKQKDTLAEQIKQEEVRKKAIVDSFDKFTKFDPWGSDGKLDSKWMDGAKIKGEKITEEFERAANIVRKQFAVDDLAGRLAFEQVYNQKKAALEAALREEKKVKDLATTQLILDTQYKAIQDATKKAKDKFSKDIDDQKLRLAELETSLKALEPLNSLKKLDKPEYVDYNDTRGLRPMKEEEKKAIDEYNAALQERLNKLEAYKNSLAKLKSEIQVIDGKEVFNPKNQEDLEKAAKDLVDASKILIKARDEVKKIDSQSLPDSFKNNVDLDNKSRNLDSILTNVESKLKAFDATKGVVKTYLDAIEAIVVKNKELEDAARKALDNVGKMFSTVEDGSKKLNDIKLASTVFTQLSDQADITTQKAEIFVSTYVDDPTVLIPQDDQTKSVFEVLDTSLTTLSTNSQTWKDTVVDAPETLIPLSATDDSVFKMLKGALGELTVEEDDYEATYMNGDDYVPTSDVESVFVTLTNDINTLKQSLDNLIAQYDLNNLFNIDTTSIQQLIQYVDQINLGRIDTDLQSVEHWLDVINDRGNQAIYNLSSQIANAAQMMYELVQATYSQTNAMQELNFQYGNFNTISAGDSSYSGYADGGWVGGRGGVDNNIIRASRGEFVVNPQSAGLASELLDYINTNRTQNLNALMTGHSTTSNSSITNNRVGDVIINTNGPVNDPRALANTFRRELKRQNIRGLQ